MESSNIREEKISGLRGRDGGGDRRVKWGGKGRGGEGRGGEGRGG